MPEPQAHNLLFLGVALKWPIVVTSYGRPALVTGKSLLEQSIKAVLNTAITEKYFHAEYGSRLDELLFEQQDETVTAQLLLFIKEAIEKWEKRVKFVNVTFSIPGESAIQCNISYEILATNQIESFIYPYYRKIIY